MICLYDSKETNFDNNGLVILSDCESFFTIEKNNDLYEVEFEHPLDDRGKWQYILEGNIVKNNDGQLFRIYRKIKTLSGIKVNARHIFYDLLDNFIEGLTLTSVSGASALASVLSNTQFTHSFQNISDLTANGNLIISKTNPINAIMGKDGIIASYGGELERDNFTIKLLQARGLDRGVLVSYGKNIVGIEETIDLDSVITRIYPTGKDGLIITEKYVDSQYINNYPNPKIKEIQFSDIKNETELRTAAQSYFTSTKCDMPLVNYQVDFLELSKTEEYKNYAVLERVYMGDTVTVRHSKLNIDLKCKVISIKKNDLTGRIEKVELGSFKSNLATGITSSIAKVKAEIIDAKSSLQIAIDNATTQINSALGGYVIKRNGELLIMDTEDINTATKVWRWNQGGLGFSGTGYNGEFRTAITADGHIVADFMDTGTLNATLINVLGLVVGSNVTMGPNAYISWNNVTNQPFIPTQYTDDMALSKINTTYLDINGVWTPQVYAQNINTSQAKITTAQIENLVVGTNVTMGSNATISWTKVTDQPSIPNGSLIDGSGNYIGAIDYTTQVNGKPTILTANDIQTTVITKEWIATLGLLVGTEIQMGANASISWSQVNNQPFIPSTASDVGALPSNSTKLTYIDATGVYSPTMIAEAMSTQSLSTVTITGTVNAQDKVNIGVANSYGTCHINTATDALRFQSHRAGSYMAWDDSGVLSLYDYTNASHYASIAQVDSMALFRANSSRVNSVVLKYQDGTYALISPTEAKIVVNGTERYRYYSGTTTITGDLSVTGTISGTVSYASSAGSASSASYASSAGSAYGLSGSSSIALGSTGCTMNPGGGTLRLGNSQGAYISVVGEQLIFYKSNGTSTTLVY